MPNVDLQDVKKGLNLAEELELHFIQTDHSTVRSATFKRELRNCLAPYRGVLVELEKKLQSKINVKMSQVRKRFSLLKDGTTNNSQATSELPI